MRIILFGLALSISILGMIRSYDKGENGLTVLNFFTSILAFIGLVYTVSIGVK